MNKAERIFIKIALTNVDHWKLMDFFEDKIIKRTNELKNLGYSKDEILQELKPIFEQTAVSDFEASKKISPASFLKGENSKAYIDMLNYKNKKSLKAFENLGFNQDEIVKLMNESKVSRLYEGNKLSDIEKTQLKKEVAKEFKNSMKKTYTSKIQTAEPSTLKKLVPWLAGAGIGTGLTAGAIYGLDKNKR